MKVPQKKSAASDRVPSALIDNLRNLTITTREEPADSSPEDQRRFRGMSHRGKLLMMRAIRKKQAKTKSKQERLRRLLLNPNLRYLEELNRKDSEDEGKGPKFQCCCHYCVTQRLKSETDNTDMAADNTTTTVENAESDSE